MNMNMLSRVLGNVIKYAVLFFVLVITIYPVIWMISGSLKSEQEFYNNIWGIAQNPQFHNYVSAWIRADLSQKYLNSILVTVCFLVFIIPINCCAAYAIARLKFKFKNLIYTYLLIGIMIPSGIIAIPAFSVALEFNLVDSRLGLIIFYVAQAIAFGIFILRSFFISLPKGLEEAAFIDGCTKFQSFIKIIIPLAVPGIMTQVIFSGLTVWNEYFLANVLIRSEKLQTLPVGLKYFVGKYVTNYPELFAALVCVTIPMVIVYLLGQKAFIEGLTAGAIKG